MSSHVLAITDDSFDQEVISASIPVLVDFWAAWCGPCKALAPTLDELSKSYENKVKFTKMDVDNNPNTPSKFGVRGIPTLILFKEGQVKATQVGLVNKSDLTKFLDEHI